ncbi:hypothetical protein JCM10908_000818 [Rhodotorula pacifica]|uniref:uncharacterized protein n=1 Tax=Rhodotorula pacifica TaxID=1495444 RepID=UPI00317CBBE8
MAAEEVPCKLEDGVAGGSTTASQVAQTLRYRSDTFLTAAATFPSAYGFFEAARRGLLSDCGHEAFPSKQKPTKVSVRCEKYGSEGCPFRLCAFLEEDATQSAVWRLSGSNCMWSHSHEPRANPAQSIESGRVAIAGAQLPAVPAKRPRGPDPISAASRTVVLFHAGDRFDSIDDFIARARLRSLDQYDVACWSIHRTDSFMRVG